MLSSAFRVVVVRGAKPDELVRLLRNQQAILISVVVYPLTLHFVTISLLLKNARAYCIFDIYLAKPLCKYM